MITLAKLETHLRELRAEGMSDDAEVGISFDGDCGEHVLVLRGEYSQGWETMIEIGSLDPVEDETLDFPGADSLKGGTPDGPYDG